MDALCNRFGSSACVAAAIIVALCTSAPARAGGTRAGTSIDNQAVATFDGPGGTQSVTSNTVKLRVDELLDVVVASGDPGPVPARNGDEAAVLRFRITNAGNGSEAFALGVLGTVGGDDFDPTSSAIVIDTNGNGAYDPGIDTVYVAGSSDPVLAPDESITAFIVSRMPTGVADAARAFARLTATAATGSGTPGTAFAGLGQGGGDAIVGTTTARASADGIYVIASVSVAFVKSAVVLDPFGGTRAVPGSVVTYRLSAELTGSGSLLGLRLADTIPAGTTYRPGTITLGGVAQTDGADADAARFDAGSISVGLGTAAAGTTHVVTFKVRID